MKHRIKHKFNRQLSSWLTVTLLALCLILPSIPAQAAPIDIPGPASSGQAIPIDQLGLTADKQAATDHSSIVATAEGATVRADFQDLAGRLTADGLWLHSTDDATFTPAPFRVMATVLGRTPGRADPGRRSGDDQVARVQGHDLGDVFNEVADREDQVGGVVILHDLLVDAGDEVQAIGRIAHLIGGDEGAHRPGTLAVLAEGPLRGGALKGAGGEIVEGAIAEDAREAAAIPCGLLHAARVTKPIAKGQLITRANATRAKDDDA